MSSPVARGAWGDGETWALIEAWGPMYLGRNGGSLRDGEWRQVRDAVNAHRAAAGGRFNRSVVQCQYRIDALKSQYKKELAKGEPTPGCRNFAQLRVFLAGHDGGPPPGFNAKMPPASFKEEEMVVEEMEEKEGEEEASDGASGSKTVPAKRHFSSLHEDQDILDQSGGPAPGFPPRMPATAKKEKTKVNEEDEVKEVIDREGPANAGCCMAAVVTKLAEVYQRVEMERLSVEKEKMAMERAKRAAKVEAEDLGPGETHDN